MSEAQNHSSHFMQKPANSYVIDAESTAEIGRLINQDRLVTEAMGGLFPAVIDVGAIQSVLDIGCGPGGWVQEVAFQYPEMQVVGIDISQSMIAYAQAQAQVQGLENARFLVMDATKRWPLQMPSSISSMPALPMPSCPIQRSGQEWYVSWYASPDPEESSV